MPLRGLSRLFKRKPKFQNSPFVPQLPSTLFSETTFSTPIMFGEESSSAVMTLSSNVELSKTTIPEILEQPSIPKSAVPKKKTTSSSESGESLTEMTSRILSEGLLDETLVGQLKSIPKTLNWVADRVEQNGGWETANSLRNWAKIEEAKVNQILCTVTKWSRKDTV